MGNQNPLNEEGQTINEQNKKDKQWSAPTFQTKRASHKKQG